jgi:glycosyltransferase involved in cell wall biosynthesis
MKVAIVIPCYNESGAIADFIASLHALRLEQRIDLTPVVVNDCSTDDTLAVVRGLDCTVLDLPVNLGIGGAVQTGFRYARRRGFDVAVQMDGDGQHPASELPKLLAHFASGQADVVIGSRFIDKEGFQSTALRRIGIAWFSFFVHLLTRQRITDPTSGLRALGPRAMQIVDAFYPKEYPEPEILVHFVHKGLRVVEVPVLMQERLAGVSSIHSWKSVYYMLKVSFGILFSHLRLSRYGKH